MALPPVQRTHMEVKLRAGPIPPPIDGPSIPAIQYRCMTAEQCRCRGVETQSMAGMLDAQADSIARQSCGCVLPKSCCQKRRAALQQDILRGMALELRNANAGLALNLYYRLVENEALADLAAESLAAVSDALTRIEELKAKGFKATEDVESMRRQLVELKSDQTRVQLALDEMNTELIRLLNLEDGGCQCKLRIWPDVHLKLPPGAPDCELSVAEGMAHRPELFMLQRLADGLDLCTLQVVRQLLGSLNSLLTMGSAQSIPCLGELVALLCGKGAMAEELETRRAQVQEYRADRMRIISGEIRQDVFALCRRAALVSLAEEQVRSWARRIADLEQRRDKGMTNFMEFTDAKLKWLKSRGDVVREQIAWERERVQLHLHQGMLLLPSPPPSPPPPVVLPSIPEVPAPEQKPEPQAKGHAGPSPDAWSLCVQEPVY
jgi:hypothetical protein